MSMLNREKRYLYLFRKEKFAFVEQVLLNYAWNTKNDKYLISVENR